MDNCNILLQIDGVKGSSTLADYADQIECYSWTFNVVQPSSNTKSGTERTAANPMFSDITLTKETDVSSTDLLRLCATAKEVDKVTLTITVERIIVLNSEFYGNNYITIARDEQGNAITYKGKTSIGAKGETNTIKASVKEHTVYNGVKQTVIQRPKVLEEVLG